MPTGGVNRQSYIKAQIMILLIAGLLIGLAVPHGPTLDVQSIKELYSDTCAEGYISDDNQEAHGQGFDCALELIESSK